MDAMDIRWVMVPAVGTLPAYSIRDADYEKEKMTSPRGLTDRAAPL